MTKKNVFDGAQHHDLAHLRPFQMTIGREDWSSAVDISFSWHCYTRTPDAGEDVYPLRDGNEVRCFCPVRYDHSKRLPAIISGIFDKTVYQTGKGNYVCIEIVEADGSRYEYGVYFQLRKPGKGRPLKLFVESAYPLATPGERHYKPSNRQKIRFRVLAYNIHRNRPITFKR